MFLNFKTIEETDEPLEEFFFEEVVRNYSLEERFFNCVCNHPYYNHYLCNGKCYAHNCSCEKLIYCDLEMNLVFTLSDLFEVKNPDHSEADSPQWWIEFAEWYKLWQTMNI